MVGVAEVGGTSFRILAVICFHVLTTQLLE